VGFFKIVVVLLAAEDDGDDNLLIEASEMAELEELKKSAEVWLLFDLLMSTSITVCTCLFVYLYLHEPPCNLSHCNFGSFQTSPKFLFSYL